MELNKEELLWLFEDNFTDIINSLPFDINKPNLPIISSLDNKIDFMINEQINDFNHFIFKRPHKRLSLLNGSLKRFIETLNDG